jgi:hypothetical protein
MRMMTMMRRRKRTVARSEVICKSKTSKTMNFLPGQQQQMQQMMMMQQQQQQQQAAAQAAA